MKLKLIAAVVGLALSAASQATIVPTTTIGGSDLLLDVWEQGAANGAPDQSLTLDLGITFSQFVAASGTSATLATLLSSDSTWSNFLATSDTADAGTLQWSVIASGNKVSTRPAIFGTVAVGVDPTTSGTFGFPTNNDINQSNTQVSTFINNLNVSPNPNEQVGLKGSGDYYQDLALANYNGVSFSNNNNIGATANVAYISNVATGTVAPAVVTQLAGTMTFAQVGSNYVLSYNVAAVPEAPGFGMMALAGAAALGFLAIRRRSA